MDNWGSFCIYDLSNDFNKLRFLYIIERFLWPRHCRLKLNRPHAGGVKSKTVEKECQSEFVNGIQGMRLVSKGNKLRPGNGFRPSPE
jgi:hypothetical protein